MKTNVIPVIPAKAGNSPHLRDYRNSSLLLLLLTLLTLPLLSQTATFTDTRDGHQYKAVTIGTQTWMAENLAWLPSVNRVGTGLFEEECRYVYSYDGTDTGAAKSVATFGVYGVLYNWMAARSACPAGWHLPTDQEWIELERFLGMTAEETLLRDWRTTGDAGLKLKSASGWTRGNGADAFGFAALPGGCRGYGGFESKGYAGYFWTASTIDGDNGWRRGICSDSKGISRQEDRRYFGCSVRCVKNKAE
jgi:uncharacterized protein (TIGR02145 family)